MQQFSLIVKRLDILVNTIKPCTTDEVLKEINLGVKRGVLPPADLNRIEILKMTPEEKEIFSKLIEKLGKGEASCLAIAMVREIKILTDDWDARKYAQKFGIPVSGTIGVLVLAVKKELISKNKGNNLLSEMIRMGFYSPVDELDGLL
jgi:hypothetical protein